MLMKGFSETLVSATIDHLRDLGYINDVSLAKELNREAMAGKFFSHNGARRYLLHKGIPQHVIGLVCAQDKEEDLQNAQRYIEKKLRMINAYPPETVKRRLYSQLLRRGYSHEAITTVLRNISLNEEV